MNLNQLALFLAVVEEGSVTRGAERASVSQPAVSRAVADLERALGVRLLDRGPKGVVPTEAGRTLAGYAARIFGLEREAEEALADLRGLRAGRLALGASTTIGDHLLPPVLARLMAAHPGLEVSMEVANTEAIQEGVASGRYDAGFTEGGADPARFEVAAFAEDELIVVGPPNGPTGGLDGRPFVMREAGSGTRAVVERGLREAGIEPRVVAALGSTAAIKRAVAEGMGLAMVSALALESELASGALVRVAPEVRIVRPLHRVRLAWRRESPALRALMRMIALSSPLPSPPEGRGEPRPA